MPSLPYWATTDGNLVRLYRGDVLRVLAGLPAASVQCVVTSPPYWGLRSYLPGMVKPKADCPAWVLKKLSDSGIHAINRIGG
jgi:DNA modification methylase